MALEGLKHRYRIFQRDFHTCVYCFKRVKPSHHPRGNYLNQLLDDDDATIDHIHPRSLGGRDGTLNSVTACPKCNQSLGNAYGEMKRKMAIAGRLKILRMHGYDWSDMKCDKCSRYHIACCPKTRHVCSASRLNRLMYWEPAEEKEGERVV
jgi:hypothetical protein